MAKTSQKADDSAQGEESAKKKRGFFGFLRRKKKDDVTEASAPEDEATNAAGSTDQQVSDADDAQAEPAKKPARKPRRKTAKSTTRATGKKAGAKSAAAKDKDAKDKDASEKDATDSAPPKKRGRPRKKPVAAKEPEIAASQSADDPNAKAKEEETPADVALNADGEPAKKRGLFGFLKRKKTSAQTDDAVLAQQTAETDAASDDSQERADKPKKKGLFGFLKRKKAKEDAAAKPAKSEQDSSDDVLLMAVTGIGVDGSAASDNKDDSPDEAPPKKKFLSKKLIIILFAVFGVTGATGAAALVFAGPLFGDAPIEGLACSLAHKTEYDLMKEKRVTAVLRADSMAPRERILMLIQYTKFLTTEYEDANLFTVSVVDTDGPTHRSQYRGNYVGAQVIHAPDPLLSLATDEKWEVRYVNADYASSGLFLGDRFKLTKDDIAMLKEEILPPADCIAEIEAKLAAEAAEAENASEAADEEADTQESAVDGAAEGESEGEEGAEEVAAEQEPAEPGFIDNMLAMVGLGGGDEGEIEAPEGALPDDVMQPYPPEANGDIVDGEDVQEEGMFSGLLKLVGLGADEDIADDQVEIPGVLGQRIIYD